MKILRTCWDCRYVRQEIQEGKRVLVCNLDTENKLLIGPVISPPIIVPEWCNKEKINEIKNEEVVQIPSDWEIDGQGNVYHEGVWYDANYG